MHRRDFLELLGGASLAWPGTLRAFESRTATGGGPRDETFWSFVRDQFTLAPNRIYLNNGTLGPSPRPVLDATLEHQRRVAATHPPGVDWDGLTTHVADLLGGDPAGWVFPRNTTEAVSFVAHGLDVAAGDEVVVTDHEHIGGKSSWELLAARRGAVVRRATLPVPAKTASSLEDAILAVVSRRTRVVCVSHVTFTTGTLLPVRALGVRLAADGVTFVVDGAHPPGMLVTDVGGAGADFYAASAHKWLLAPQGTGLLYVAPSWRERLWPTVASGGWDDVSLGAHRLNHLGTVDESRLAGLAAAVSFHLALGPERVEARVRYLADLLEDGLRGIPGVFVASPSNPELRTGMLAFAVDGVSSLELQRHLATNANARTRVIGEYGYGWMRLSTHVYNGPAELAHVLELIHTAARSGLPSGGTPS